MSFEVVETDKIEIKKGSRSMYIRSIHRIYVEDMKTMFDKHFDYFKPENDVLDFSEKRSYFYPELQRSVIHYFEPEPISEIVLYNDFLNLQKDDVVIDCGAYCGLSSIFFARKCAKVYAFEPDLFSCECAKENFNMETNITIFDKAIARENCLKYFSDEGAQGSLFAPTCRTGGGQRAVKCISIDSFVESEKLDRLDAIKMDIEGAEYEAIHGCINTLKKFHPKIAMEIHTRGSGPDVDYFLKILNPLGYSTSIVKGWNDNFVNIFCEYKV